jgi:hypothetical protein
VPQHDLALEDADPFVNIRQLVDDRQKCFSRHLRNQVVLIIPDEGRQRCDNCTPLGDDDNAKFG